MKGHITYMEKVRIDEDEKTIDIVTTYESEIAYESLLTTYTKN